MTFDFDPPDGYRNIARFPKTPESEADFRDSMQKLLDQLRDELNSGGSSAVGVHSMARQAVMNGNYDVWQRGTSLAVLDGMTSYLADRWRLQHLAAGGVSPSITHSRQPLVSGDIPGVFYFYRVTSDGAGSGFGDGAVHLVDQTIENGARFLAGNGKKVTVSFWARSSIANKKLAFNITQEYGSGGAPTPAEQLVGEVVTLTAEWKKYKMTLTTNLLAGKTFGSNNDDCLRVRFWHMWGSNFINRFGAAGPESFVGAGDVDIAQVQLNAGDTALPFQPRSFAEELGLCQRYYEKSYDLSLVLGTVTATNAEQVIASTSFLLAIQNVRFKVRKRIPPTVTVFATQNGASGNASEYDAGSSFVANRPVSVGGIGETCFNVFSSGGTFVPGNFERFQWAAGAEL